MLTFKADVNIEMSTPQADSRFTLAKRQYRVFPNNFLLICVILPGIIPSAWNKSIIKPVPKTSKSDPRVPLNYRGISLLSTVYKLYSNILLYIAI